jgi:APA family basic amino acid/polyamine antiporter
VFAGFTLGVSTFFTVLGLFVLRIRQPDLPRPYRTTWYPLPPLVYLAITGWTLGYIIAHRPKEGLWGLAIIAGGALLYLLIRRGRPTEEVSS